ncbi:MAG: hypothetical protein IPM02_03055 [Betaproteobacteria bacterium]|nr:hypothetical protein [Betaproteobacteria bacterium]
MGHDETTELSGRTFYVNKKARLDRAFLLCGRFSPGAKDHPAGVRQESWRRVRGTALKRNHHAEHSPA